MSPDWLQVAAVQFELLLAVWLVFGRRQPAAWLTAVVTFLAFAGLNLRAGLLGQASCGCFGSIELRPWSALGVDVAVLVILLVGRPHGIRSAVPVSALFLGGYGLAVLAWTVVAWSVSGSTAAAMASLRGQPLAATSRAVDFGAAAAGTEAVGRVTLRNLTGQPIRVIGGTSDCSCTAIHDLPLLVPANDTQSLAVYFRLPNELGAVSRLIWLYTDDPAAPLVELILTARSVAP